MRIDPASESYYQHCVHNAGLVALIFNHFGGRFGSIRRPLREVARYKYPVIFRSTAEVIARAFISLQGGPASLPTVRRCHCAYILPIHSKATTILSGLYPRSGPMMLITELFAFFDPMFSFLKKGNTLLLLAAATCAVDQKCASFTFESNITKLIASTFFEAGAHVNISTPYEAIDINTLPAFCRVQVEITTNATANSTALTEVWLPTDWNGRFLTIGNSGFSGSVSIAELAFTAVKQGFAGVSTNSGHSASQDNGTWALGNDNAMIDFGWRAMHLSVITGKEIVQKFYGRSHTKAYYTGCSEGGRQGLKEVQEFPDDFDGVVVGSPANWASHLISSLVRGSLNVLPTTSSRWIPENTWTNVIHPEVLRQCDELDGIKDEVISNPLLCSFRPETLACRQNQDPETCLTISQIKTVHKIYSDYYETNQTYIFGGFYPGSEKGFSMVFGPDTITLGTQYFQDWITNDTTWDISRFDLDTILLADSINPGQSNAISPDLRRFTDHKGKVLHYAGWAENLISAGNSLHYYETVNSFMRANTNIEMDDFYRLFMVPGMAHW
ncbi:hypothetical protein QCA50_006201 [Cerrena zonata]|uniref:Carboxylic ester hydrolase n=1 Tax=Cerrena zonata TaxID=2478898 RepID=A0AAW0GLL4_9APHY